MLTTDERYQKYVQWCKSIKIAPAPFDVWRKTVAMICENATGEKYSTVLIKAN